MRYLVMACRIGGSMEIALIDGALHTLDAGPRALVRPRCWRPLAGYPRPRNTHYAQLMTLGQPCGSRSPPDGLKSALERDWRPAPRALKLNSPLPISPSFLALS